MFRKCIVVFLLAAYVLSCKKSDENLPVDLKQERESLLIGKEWHMIHTTEEFLNDLGDTTHIEEDYPFSLDHLNDDFTVYNSNHSYTWNDNTVLDPYDTIHVLSGTWSISDDGNMLEQKYQLGSNPVLNYSVTFQITAISAFSFTLMQDVTIAKHEYTFSTLR